MKNEELFKVKSVFTLQELSELIELLLNSDFTNLKNTDFTNI